MITNRPKPQKQLLSALTASERVLLNKSRPFAGTYRGENHLKRWQTQQAINEGHGMSDPRTSPAGRHRIHTPTRTPLHVQPPQEPQSCANRGTNVRTYLGALGHVSTETNAEGG